MSDAWISVFCAGGPLDGKQVTIRPADRFLAAWKSQDKAWIYQQRGEVFEVVTDHDGSLVYPHGPTTGERAMDWARLPLSTDALQVVSLGDAHEDYAGDPVDDGWANSTGEQS